MMAPQDFHQGRCNPLWQDGRHFGADSQDLHVGNLSQSGEKPIDPLVGQDKRVAARNQHVAYSGLGRDISYRFFPLPGVEGILSAGLAHHARARAVAAIDGASPRNQKQDPIRIAMHKPRNGHIAILIERVLRLFRASNVFRFDHDERFAKRLVGGIGVQQTCIIRRNSNRKHFAMACERSSLTARKPQYPFESRGILYAGS
jgi:hypothetical protein